MVTSVVFAAPGKVEVREEPQIEPKGDQVLVRSRCSAISAGTELMILRGEAPSNLAADAILPSLVGKLEFPIHYGYAAVGEVIALGAEAPPELAGSTVFAFHPHASHFVARSSEVVRIQDDMSPETALFIPNMETAVNFLHDGAPLVGERVVVLGQGVVGLLTTTLLAKLPLESLVALERYPIRRAASVESGAHRALEPEAATELASTADLTYELSGDPAALSLALTATGFDGRIVLGSWYGSKPAELDLGGRYHRSRIRLITSQVSTIAPKLSGRWDKARRLGVARELARQTRPDRWITHRFPVERAADAYSLLADHPQEALQVILTYD